MMAAREHLLWLFWCAVFGSCVGFCVGVLWPDRPASACVCADTDAATTAAGSPLWGAP